MSAEPALLTRALPPRAAGLHPDDDPGHGWRLDHPIGKCAIFQRHLFERRLLSAKTKAAATEATAPEEAAPASKAPKASTASAATKAESTPPLSPNTTRRAPHFVT